MERKHSWTWLPTRLNNLQPSDPKANPKRRPPIAQLEQLEDRVLLSAATTGGGGTDAILIGLLKGQVDLRSSEINFLKVVEGLNTGTPAQADALLKITDALWKIDGAVTALTVDSVSAQKVHKEDYLKIKIDEVLVSSFAKIDQQLGAFGDGSVDKLLPAVQRLQDATSAFTKSLSDLPAVQFKQTKGLEGFLKIEGELLKIDAITTTAAKIHDITITKPVDKASAKLLAKMDTAFQKIDADIIAVFGDGSVSKAFTDSVDALKIQTESALIGLLNPAPVGTPTTTVLTTITTSDTIS